MLNRTSHFITHLYDGTWWTGGWTNERMNQFIEELNRFKCNTTMPSLHLTHITWNNLKLVYYKLWLLHNAWRPIDNRYTSLIIAKWNWIPIDMTINDKLWGISKLIFKCVWCFVGGKSKKSKEMYEFHESNHIWCYQTAVMHYYYFALS